MSDRTANFSPSRIRPMAMPATGRAIGTPASISARLVPQTVAIEDEPLDSVISETTRIVYGNCSIDGRIGLMARQASLPWPISRRPGEPMRRLTDRVGREVVVQQEVLLDRALEAVDELLVVAGAEGRNDQRLRLAAGEQRRAVGARQNADFRGDRANRLQVAAVDAVAGVEHVPADDLGLEVVDDLAQLLGRNRAGFDLRCIVRLDLGIGGIDRGIAGLLVGDLVGGAQITDKQARYAAVDA